MNNKSFFLLVFSVLLMGSTYAGSKETVPKDSLMRLEGEFDKISLRWDLISAELEEYEGLGAFCLQKEFRSEVIEVLEEIHHFDSLLYKRLKKMASVHNKREIRKTVKQIEELETEFGIKEFTSFLNQECKDRREVEKARKEYKGNFGENTYDGQKAVVENSLQRYIHHVTHLVDHVRKHIHHLHIDDQI